MSIRSIDRLISTLQKAPISVIRHGFDQLNHFVIVFWANIGNVHSTNEEMFEAAFGFVSASVLSPTERGSIRLRLFRRLGEVVLWPWGVCPKKLHFQLHQHP